MYQKLVSHNDDLRRLVDKGYAVDFDSNYLIIRDIPYLDSNLKLNKGAFVSTMVIKDGEWNVSCREDHQVFFAGSTPYGLNGQLVPNLGGGPRQLALSEECADVVVERIFSNKLKKNGDLRPFDDFFEKIEHYVGLISAPAMAKYKDATPLTFRKTTKSTPDSVFKYPDTLTSKAEIVDLASKFKNDIVAIIGLGGTGAYILDFLVDTPVKEIRAFDNDLFHIHNSYRSPGKLSPKEFDKKKAKIYQKRYENFRYGLNCQDKFIDASSIEELDGVTFAFVCVDKGSSRSEIFKLLISKKIPFIDVGMGLRRENGSLDGLVRFTYYSSENGEKTLEKGYSSIRDNTEDMYKTNIQIGELNALNASLAVIKFKQLRGFYSEDESPYHLLFGISDLKIAGEGKI